MFILYDCYYIKGIVLIVKKECLVIYFYMYSFYWYLEEDSDLMFEIK